MEFEEASYLSDLFQQIVTDCRVSSFLGLFVREKFEKQIENEDLAVEPSPLINTNHSFFVASISWKENYLLLAFYSHKLDMFRAFV